MCSIKTQTQNAASSHAQVLFNIGGPALNQLQNAANKQKSPGFKKATKAVSKAVKRRAVAGAIAGLSAASLLAAAPQADAAQELAQLAAGAGPGACMACNVWRSRWAEE